MDEKTESLQTDESNTGLQEADDSVAEPLQADEGETERKRKKRKSRAIKIALKIVIWCIIILIVVFLTLFLSSKIGEFESIADMLRFIRSQF